MLNQRTFSDILHEVHESHPSENTMPSWESSLDPAWMTQLMAEIGPLQFRSSYIYRYKAMHPTPPPPVVRKPHAMTEMQELAFAFLNQFQMQALDLGFFKQELKSAYRSALLKTHPDQGGTAETFQQVKKSYEILQVFVTK